MSQKILPLGKTKLKPHNPGNQHLKNPQKKSAHPAPPTTDRKDPCGFPWQSINQSGTHCRVNHASIISMMPAGNNYPFS